MNLCNVVRDLLPLVVEEMAGEDTKEFVENHLRACPACRAQYERMRAGRTPLPQEGVALRTMWRTLAQRSALIIVLTAALVLSACLPLFSWLIRPVYQPYAEGLFSVSVQEDTLEIVCKGGLQLAWYRCVWPQNEDCDIYLCGYTTRLRPAPDTSVLRISAKDYGPFHHVFYSPNNGQEDVLLWGDEATCEGYGIFLPRLVLNYYLLDRAGSGACVCALSCACATQGGVWGAAARAWRASAPAPVLYHRTFCHYPGPERLLLRPA